MNTPHPFASLGDPEKERRARMARARLRTDFRAQYQRKHKVTEGLLGFNAYRPEGANIEFIVNIMTGQVAGKEQWAGEWLRVRAVNAIRWLDKYQLSLSPVVHENKLSGLPAWLFQPSEEDQKVIRRLTRKAKTRSGTLTSAKRFDGIYRSIGAGISATIAAIITTIGAVVIYLAWLGNLRFGLKQLF
jgi:hypothetical protein